MEDDYDKIAKLVNNGYTLPDALNQIDQSVADDSIGTDQLQTGVIGADEINTTELTPIVQIQREDDGDVATGTTILPADDTIPQNDEGDEYITVSITPKAIGNILIIEAQIYVAHTITTTRSMALFKDSDADAIAAIAEIDDADRAVHLNLQTEISVASLSAITFKIRAGGAVSGTTTFNGSAGSVLYGGVSNSYIKVTEVLQ
jgi:hypothetical protein